MNWLKGAWTTFLLSFLLGTATTTTSAFQIGSKVFTRLREEHTSYVNQILWPVKPEQKASSLSKAARDGTDASSDKQVLSRRNQFPCFPCMLTSLYSHLDSYTSTKLTAASSDLNNPSNNALSHKVIQDFILIVYKAITYPFRLFYRFFSRVLDRRKHKEPDQINGDTQNVSTLDVVDDLSEVVLNGEQTPTAATESDVAIAPGLENGPAPPSPVPATQPKAYPVPKGERWAIASSDVDLSGDWKMLVTEDFKKEYDKYLERMGQPPLVRSIALGLVGMTTEYTEQKEDGRTLLVRGTNARGVWERSLVASGADSSTEEFEAYSVPVITAESEEVMAESWWENEGTTHHSWMRGVTKYGGGAFEAKRYLEESGDVLVCESTFHFNDEAKQPAKVTWRFQRKS